MNTFKNTSQVFWWKRENADTTTLMCACSAHCVVGLSRGEDVVQCKRHKRYENDKWTQNTWIRFGAKTLFSNLSELVFVRGLKLPRPRPLLNILGRLTTKFETRFRKPLRLIYGIVPSMNFQLDKLVTC